MDKTMCQRLDKVHRRKPEHHWHCVNMLQLTIHTVHFQSSLQHWLIQGHTMRAHGEDAARTYNGILGQSPHWGPGAESLVRESGRKAP